MSAFDPLPKCRRLCLGFPVECHDQENEDCFNRTLEEGSMVPRGLLLVNRSMPETLDIHLLLQLVGEGHEMEKMA
jgi:hypothetical protein